MIERDLFLNALDIADPADRAAFLDRECAGNPALRQAVEGLLVADGGAGQLLNQPHRAAGQGERTGEFGGSESERAADFVGSVIAGKYKLLQLVGEGGMGAVYMADQLEPVKRRVAVKLIRTERGNSKTILSRFEAERQAIALMDHPNIAKLLDAGETPPTHVGGSPTPFFVMELVKGVPLTQFCDEHRLNILDRLNLFTQICAAVQHAHQKGIIHRDLKPTNVLVESHDGKPIPKVIDFGLAKAISGMQLSEHTLFTALGQVAGTPLYMAPEQAAFNAVDVDTRADVYALGVILYELLTGTTPIERETFKKAAFDEMMRMIREQDPMTPSSRLSSSDSKASVAAVRQMEPARLGRYVRGELDWIVMKALSKERERRYETANGFAKDIERFLNHEPVLAGPPSASYRVRKFVRRNRPQVIAGSLVLLALLVGIAGTTIGLVRAERARQGEERQRVQAQKKSQEAEDREAESRAVLEFVDKRVFAAARPAGQAGGLGRDVTLRRAVEAALPFVDQGFKDQPLIEARLRVTLGNSFQYLGASQIAADQFQRARVIYSRLLGPDHPDTISSMENLTLCYALLGRYADAVQLYEETLTLQKTGLGSDLPDKPLDTNSSAVSDPLPGRYAAVLQLHEKTILLMKSKLGLDNPDTLKSMHGLAVIYGNLDRHEDAVRLNEEVLAVRKAKLGPDHADTLKSMNNLANGYEGLDRHADALALREVTLAIWKVKLGPDHPSTLGSMHNLANSYSKLGRHADALALCEKTLALRKTALGPDHRDTLDTMNNLANSYTALGRHADALKLDEEVLALRKAKFGPDHSDTLECMREVAKDLFNLDRGPEAVRLIDDCLQRATGKVVKPRLIPTLMTLRLHYFEKLQDAAGCRATVELWEALNRTDAISLYNAACFRAVTAAVIRATDKSEAATKDAAAEADRAMDWLRKATTAGYNNVANMKKDKDLDALRDREDFKKLMTELEKKK